MTLLQRILRASQSSRVGMCWLTPSKRMTLGADHLILGLDVMLLQGGGCSRGATASSASIFQVDGEVSMILPCKLIEDVLQ